MFHHLTPLLRRFSLVVLLLTASTFGLVAKDFVVVIDPGHGGKDYGAIGKITNEKTINLNVAKKLGEKIAADDKNVKVVYTRNKDVFVALNERAKIANKAKGDLFISIHVNSVARKNKNRTKIAGAEVYTCGLHRSDDNLAVARRENSVMYLESDYSEKYSGFDPSSPESYIAFELNQSKHLDRSIEFASLAQDELTTTAGRVDKGVKQAGFWVLWSTSMPAVLVELDFICNPNSEKFLASDAGVEKLATALYNAFCEYYNRVTPSDSGAKQVTPTEPRGDNVTPDKPAEPTSDQRDQATTEVVKAGEIEYRVQVLANEEQLPQSSPRFKGETVEEYFDRGLYKYTVGRFASQNEAKKTLPRLRKLFPEAFIIKMRDGKRVN